MYEERQAKASKKKALRERKLKNVDVHSIEFWKNGLNLIQKDIEEFIRRV